MLSSVPSNCCIYNGSKQAFQGYKIYFYKGVIYQAQIFLLIFGKFIWRDSEIPLTASGFFSQKHAVTAQGPWINLKLYL